MVKFQLDFPWRIHEALGPDPLPLEVVRRFLNLLSVVTTKPVRFVYQQEQDLFWQQLPNWRGGGIEVVLRFLSHVEAQNNGGPHRAAPLDGPDDIRDAWQTALRDEMGDLANWRTPQIIVCSERAEKWERCIHRDEATFVLLDEIGQRDQERVVIKMQPHPARESHKFVQDLRNHPYALSDLDPWDVRHIYYPDGNGRHFSECRLPRPEELDSVPLEELDEKLKELRSQAWPDHGKYWYLPPAEWSATATATKDEWRRGIFPRDKTLNPKRMHRRGFVDYSHNRIWLWHPEEGHWDVQLPVGDRKRINHGGSWLG